MARQDGRLHAHHLLHQLGVLRWQQITIVSGGRFNAHLGVSNTIGTEVQDFKGLQGIHGANIWTMIASCTLAALALISSSSMPRRHISSP